MKKLVVLFVMVCTIFAAANVSAKPYFIDDYVVTAQDTIFFNKIKFGFFKTTCTLPNNEKICICEDEILALKKDGKLYQKMPLYMENKATGKNVFMELVTQSKGYKLYRYAHLEDNDTVMGFSGIDSDKMVYRYYVYNNAGYILRLDAQNKENVLRFFY